MNFIMKSLNKLFGGIKMSWIKVIIFALCAGVYTGVINQIPFLYNTSFRDIAISYEWWVLFAVIIASNCRKWWESALKIFVFFLISQPVVFLVEIPTLPLSQSFEYYKYWFFITLVTLPGGAIAYFIKKNNILGTLIISVAMAFIGIHGVSFIFKGHILSAVFCALQIAAYVLVFTKKWQYKLIALIITVIAMCAAIYFLFAQENSTGVGLPSGEWTLSEMTVEDGSRVEITDGSMYYYYNSILSKDKKIILQNSSGETLTFDFESGNLNTIPEESENYSYYND